MVGASTMSLAARWPETKAPVRLVGQPGAGRVLALERQREGQVFALVVMVVAACEVVVGLGLIVAMFRRRIALDVDEIRELRG